MRYVRPLVIALIPLAVFLFAPNWDGGVTQAGTIEGLNVRPQVLDTLNQQSDAAVIISLRQTQPLQTPPDLPAIMREVASRQASVLSDLSAADFTLIHQYEAVPALSGRITLSGLAKLAGNPDVIAVSEDVEVHGTLTQSVPQINADLVHGTGRTGAGVEVAVLDTGQDLLHPDLSDDLLSEECFLTGLGLTPCPNALPTCSGPGCAMDDHGHGTNVTGIITSKGTVAAVGVAPDADIRAYKVLDSASKGSTADWLAALSHIIVNYPNVEVINMSLGDGGNRPPGTCESLIPAVTTAVNTLRAGGTLTVAATGNNAFKTGMHFPACLANVISVGAVYDFASPVPVPWSACTDPSAAVDQVVCFSNSDKSLDLLAPGASITSTGLGGGVSTFNGTSQAAPHVAGVAALLLEAPSTHTPDSLEYCLESTGTLIADPLFPFQTTPRVDAFAALTCGSPPDPVQEAIFSTLSPNVSIPGCEPASLMTLPSIPPTCPRPGTSPDLAAAPGTLGLDTPAAGGPGADELDAVSFSENFSIGAPEFHFTVDAISAGVAGCTAPDVNSEAIIMDAPGDIFTDRVPPASAPGCNSLYQDNLVHGLVATDEMDALTELAGTDPNQVTPCAIVTGTDPCPPFSLAAMSPTLGLLPLGTSPAHLLVPPGTPANLAGTGPCLIAGGVPCAYITPAQLGLVGSSDMGPDDLDALCWFDNWQETGMVPPNGVPDPPYSPDAYFFSLAPGSLTLLNNGFSPADILAPPPPGSPAGTPPVVIAPAAAIGLLPTDNVDGLKCINGDGGAQLAPVVQADLKKISMTADPEPQYGGYVDPTATPPEIIVSEQAFFQLTENLHNNGPATPIDVLDIKKIDCPDPGDPADFFYPGSPPGVYAAYPTQCSWVFDPLVVEVEVVGGVQYQFKDDADGDLKCDPPKVPWFNGSDFGLAPGQHGQVPLASLPTPPLPPPPAVATIDPGDCIVADSTPGVYLEVGIKKAITLDASIPVLDPSEFDVHCTGPSFHTFTVEDELQALDPNVVDPDPSNNTAQLLQQVACIADADVKLVTQDVTFPAQIDASQDVLLTIDKEIHNNGPYGPVDVNITKTITLPADCTLNNQPNGGPYIITGSVTGADVSVPTPFQEIDTIHCSQPSAHQITVQNCIDPVDQHVNDPDPSVSSNCKTTVVDFNVVATADLKILQQNVNFPGQVNVSEDNLLTIDKLIHNNGPFTPVDAQITKTITLPPDCTVNGLPGPVQVITDTLLGIDISSTTQYQELDLIHCSATSNHQITVENCIDPLDPHVTDPVPGNNCATSVVNFTALASADVKLIGQTVTFPASINVSEDATLTVDKFIHNNGPSPIPLSVPITKTISLPADCTLNGQPNVGPYIVTDSVPGVGTSVPVPFQEVDTVHCTSSSDHQLTVDNCLALNDPHFFDPDPGNNCWPTEFVNFSVNAVADGKINSSQVINPPQGMTPNTDYLVTVRNELHNNGPFGPANFDLSKSYSAPGVCTVTPPAPAITSHNLNVSVTTTVDEVWTINCPDGGPYTFSFDYTLTVNQFHVADPTPGNNDRSAYLRVCAFTDPATKLTLDCDGDGYIGSDENAIYAPSVMADHDACGTGTNTNPPANPPLPIGWPADLGPSSGPLNSNNRITILDITAFLAPVYYMNTNVDANPPGDHRWDIVPGPGIFLFDINISDLTSVIALTPPMLGGAYANNGPECPYPP